MARTKSNTTGKKKAAAIIAIVLAAAMLLGGAFAWTDFSQSFINRFRGGVSPDALLHDDFEPWVNKDVYVENTGEQDIIVRVKFTEYLQIGNDAVVGGSADNKDSWETHKFTKPSSIDCGLETHDYFAWSMTGNSKNYLHGTSEFGNDDYSGYAVGDVGPNGLTVDQTLANQAIVFLSDVIAGNSSAITATQNGCWILDDTDSSGWAYWSKPLAPNEATNLLLDNVSKTDKAPDDNFYYAIDVQMNASNVTEAWKLLDGASNDAAKYIINPIRNVVELANGDLYRETGKPGVFEKLQKPKGTPYTPKQYVFDPLDNITPGGTGDGIISSDANGDIEVDINAINFPDDNLRNNIITPLDTNSDGKLSSSELNSVKELTITDYKATASAVKDLTGLQYFTNIEVLDFDLRSASSNVGNTLDMSKMTKLRELKLIGVFASIDPSKNIALERVEIRGDLNSSFLSLPSIDYTNNINLKELKISLGDITTLDLSNCINLEYVNIMSSMFPEEIDFKSNKKLKDLIFYYTSNKLDSITVDISQTLVEKDTFSSRSHKNGCFTYLVNAEQHASGIETNASYNATVVS